MGSPNPDRSAAIDFLTRWAKLVGSVVLVAIYREREEGCPLQSFRYSPGREDAAWAWASVRNAEGFGVFYHVNRVRAGFVGKATKGDIDSVVALHADVDPRAGEDLAQERDQIGRLLATPPEGVPTPAVIVDSGRGMQAEWILSSPFPVSGDAVRAEEVERYTRELERVFRADSTSNIDRVLRAPGFVNWPSAAKAAGGAKPALARVVRFDETMRFDLATFKQAPSKAASALAGTVAIKIPAELPELSPEQVQEVEEEMTGWAVMVEKHGGSRNEAMLGVIRKLLNRGWTDEMLVAALLDERTGKLAESCLHVRGGGRRPRAREYAIRQVEALHAKPLPPQAPAGRTFPLTDLGNAERFAAANQGKVLHVPTWDRWLVWDGTRWAHDEQLRVVAMAKDVVRAIPAEAKAVQDPDEYKAILSWAMKSEKADRIRSMLSLARAELAAHQDDFDCDPWLFNIANGTIDLRSGELRPHDPADRITKVAPARFDPAAACPRWLKFLSDIFQGDADLVIFVQKLIGYAMTAIVRDRVFPICWGIGANGKSTLLELLVDLFGDYASSTPPETLIERKEQGIPNDIARLRGVRLVTCRETEEGKRLAIAVVKSLTGKDKISARFMRAEWFDFRPVCKILFATNHRPRVSADDSAAWDRIRLIPFLARFEGMADDKSLDVKLREEMSGVLNWCLAGCLLWQREGLGDVPEKVRAATDDYRDEEDFIGQFIEECCIQGPDARVLKGDLFAEYRSWSERSGHRFVSEKRFRDTLRSKGFEEGRMPKDGRSIWKGLAVTRAPVEETEF